MMFEHKSVLLYETIDSLNVKPDGIYVDGTLGGGGHHPALRRLPASDARNGEALQAANAGVAVWQKGNLRAEECGRITATLVRCFGHEVTEPIKY